MTDQKLKAAIVEGLKWMNKDEDRAHLAALAMRLAIVLRRSEDAEKFADLIVNARKEEVEP